MPHGGNTSYCGGATPSGQGNELVLSLRRMNRVREVDADNFSITVEAGCLLADVRAAAEAERVLRGEGKEVRVAAEKMMSLKGVKHVKLTTTSMGKEL